MQDSLPLKELYVPAAQGVQADCPESLKLPATQDLHADEDKPPIDGLNVPARQGVQADEALLPREGLNVPEGQSVHSDCPEPL